MTKCDRCGWKDCLLCGSGSEHADYYHCVYYLPIGSLKIWDEVVE